MVWFFLGFFVAKRFSKPCKYAMLLFCDLASLRFSCDFLNSSISLSLIQFSSRLMTSLRKFAGVEPKRWSVPIQKLIQIIPHPTYIHMLPLSAFDKQQKNASHPEAFSFALLSNFVVPCSTCFENVEDIA